MRRNFLKIFAGLLPAAFAGTNATAAAAAATEGDEPVKVVYHLLEGIDQAARAMANLRNHLRAAPDTRIVVVALGEGIRFLLSGATERNGRPFAPAVSALAAQGVQFRVCNNTLTAHKVPLSTLLPEASLVPSGVVEVARLQAREGYAYLRP